MRAFSGTTLLVATSALVLVGTGCGDGADGTEAEDVSPAADGPVSSTELDWRWRRPRPRLVSSTGSGGTSATGATGGVGGSGVVAGPVTNVVANSQCPGNAPLSGACTSYGVQCFYDSGGSTQYCTCVAFSASGTQGWVCGTTGTSSGAGGATGSGGAPTTGTPLSISDLMGSTPAPETGVAAGSVEPAVLPNSTCPGNQAVSGPCTSDGTQCTYSTPSSTHYCTCVAFSVSGAQAWECR